MQLLPSISAVIDSVELSQEDSDDNSCIFEIASELELLESRWSSRRFFFKFRHVTLAWSTLLVRNEERAGLFSSNFFPFERSVWSSVIIFGFSKILCPFNLS